MNDTMYKRLLNEEYVDEIRVESGMSRIEITTRARFKTSGLSGDCWRVSFPARYFRAGNLIYTDERNRMETAVAAMAPTLAGEAAVVMPVEDFVRGIEAVATFARKGHTVHAAKFPTLLQLVMLLPWEYLVWSERVGSQRLSDEVEKSLCYQTGCVEPATRTYRLKAERCDGGSRCLIPEDHRPWKNVLRGFCEAHAHRGDADLEDCDRNYEGWNGSAGPETASVSAEAVRRSGLVILS